MTDPAHDQLDEVEQPEEDAEGESLEERLAAAEAEAESHLNDLKRVAAEFENYRKRVARENEALSARAAERLVRELLPVVDDLERALQAAEAEGESHLNDLKRVAAEFENYRKRVARENEALSARAAERLVRELLPVVDDLERALQAAEEHEEAKLEEGVRLVHRQLAQLLEREGLAEIETDGKFDPHVHEAMLSQPSDAPEGSVIEVFQKGYKLGDHVLRPARVVVAGPKETDGDES